MHCFFCAIPFAAVPERPGQGGEWCLLNPNVAMVKAEWMIKLSIGQTLVTIKVIITFTCICVLHLGPHHTCYKYSILATTALLHSQ